jgi:mannose-6-phosphate isomerase
MYPIIFTPDYKERVWGGQKLKTVFDKEIPFEHTGESWEIACHENGQSIVKNGQYKGMTLEELLLQQGEDIIGKPFAKGDKFPLLVKIIDAKDKLSVQVHPEDDYAKKNENGELGKSEAWYVLQANEGSKLVAGLKDGVTEEIFKAKLESNELEEVLNEIEVNAGDVLDIPAGLIHAIGDGILLAEIQQNSDTTYRVYDYGRVGLDGVPRDLHVKKSLDVIDFEHKHSKELAMGIKEVFEGYEVTEYIRNKYFVLQEIVINSEYKQCFNGNGFEIYMCIKGDCVIEYDGESQDVKVGESLIIPTDLMEYKIIPNNKQVVFVKGFIDDKI